MANPVLPKVFISYCWSSPEHEKWVIDLAESLEESNVEVVLDKWDLKEGHDSIRFMEQMVTDPSVTKVIIVADKAYVAKADGRQGGVGTETQIISAEMYASVRQQDKFAVVVSEKDEDNKAYLPTYYKGRIYIDLSDDNNYAPEFERLLRWLYDKPLHVRPPRGKTPSFLLEGEHQTLGTSSHAKRVVDALASGRTTALGAFTEYLNVVNENLGRFRIVRDKSQLVDDQVVQSIGELFPAKNEFVSVVAAVATYSSTPDFGERLHSFLENLHHHTTPLPNVAYQDADFDNFRFLLHELFLSAVAVFIKHGRIDLGMAVVADYYLSEGTYTRHQPMVTFEVFQQNLTSLEYRKQRTGSNRSSIHADMLIERLAGSPLRQDDLTQADMVLFFRGQALGAHWYPITHIYLGSYGRPLEIFARANSRKSFMKISPLLGVESPEKFIELIDAMTKSGQRLGHGFHTIDLKAVTALDALAKKP
jgi:hypothetical protein